MFEMSALRFDACPESFTKCQNRFANCLIRQIVPDGLQRSFQLSYVSRFRFQIIELLQHGSPHVVVERIQVWAVWWPGVLINEAIAASTSLRVPMPHPAEI